MDSLRRRVPTAIVYGAVVIAALLAPTVVFAVFAALLLVLGFTELVSLTRGSPGRLAFATLALAVGLLALVVLREAGPVLAHHPAAGTLPVWLLLAIVPTWAADVAAYAAGTRWGRRRLAPRISPGKTWEGAVANLAGAVLAGTLVIAYAREISSGLMSIGLLTRDQAFLPPQPTALWPFAVLSAGINVAAQLGDLAESLLKRGAGVKDSGALLPGHGGMLDRIDALLFAAPVLWYYAVWRVMQ